LILALELKQIYSPQGDNDVNVHWSFDGEMLYDSKNYNNDVSVYWIDGRIDVIK